jgi:hypothetical protein
MASMLDIAGGVVIGGFILGLFYVGLSLLGQPRRPGDDDGVLIFGGFLMLLGVGAAVWLLFIHTGILPAALR